MIAVFTDNTIIFPSIEATFVSLIDIIASGSIYTALFATILRTLVAVTISLFFAVSLSVIAYRYQSFAVFLKPFLSLVKTMPTAAVIVIALLTFGREGSVLTVIFLVAFPLMYNDTLFALKHIDADLIKITKTLSGDYLLNLRRIYLPLIKPQLLSSLKSALSLSFKVCVMAELISQVNLGLGKELYFYRINLLTPEVFALTLVMILISILFDCLLRLFNGSNY